MTYIKMAMAAAAIAVAPIAATSGNYIERVGINDGRGTWVSAVKINAGGESKIAKVGDNGLTRGVYNNPERAVIWAEIMTGKDLVAVMHPAGDLESGGLEW